MESGGNDIFTTFVNLSSLIMQIRPAFLVILLCLTLFSGCNFMSGNKSTIKARFTNFPHTQFYVYQVMPASQTLIDSVSTDADGSLDVSFSVKGTSYYMLKSMNNQEIMLIIAPGEHLILNCEGKMLRKYKVEGSKESEIYAVYNDFTNRNLEKVDSLSKLFAQSHEQPDFIKVKSRLDSAYLQVFNKQKEEVVSFVKGHINSLASLLAISNDFGPNPLLSEHTHPELFLKLDSSLFVKYPDNVLVNTFHSRMVDIKAEISDRKEYDNNLKTGMPVPEIMLPNPKEKIIKLSSLQGKLTLLYFWSGWNALSRQTNLQLCSVFNKYHEKGFEIYAVSIDSDADLWQKAFMIDKAYWIHVIDVRGLTSEYCKTFAVRSLPKMMLISKNGLILSNNAELNDLDVLIKNNL